MTVFGKIPFDREFGDLLQTEKMQVKYFNVDGPTYLYYGGLIAGEWQVNRYDATTLRRSYADRELNPVMTNIDLAWQDYENLAYSEEAQVASDWPPEELQFAEQVLADPLGRLTYDPALPGYLQDFSADQGTKRLPRERWVRSFNGLDNAAELPGRITTGSPTTLTVGCWIKFTGAESYAIMGEYTGATNQRGWLLMHSSVSPGKLTYLFSSTGVSDFNRKHGSTEINDGNWHHVVAVQNDGDFELFVDGELETLTTIQSAAGSTIFNTTSAFVIGSDNGTPGAYFPGVLSDARVYSAVKTSTEVAAWYNDGQGDFADPDTAGLLGGWALEEESGSIHYDWSGNENHLTEQGDLADIWVTDVDKKWSLVDSVGYASIWNVESKTLNTVGPLVVANTAGLVNVSMSLDIKIDTQGDFVVFGNNDFSIGIIRCSRFNSSSAFSVPVGEVRVDGVPVLNQRNTIHAAISTGEWVTIEVDDISHLTGFGNGLFLSGFALETNRWDGFVRNIVIGGVAYPGPTFIPAIPSTTNDATGSPAAFTGRAPQPGKGYAGFLRGNGEDVYVDTGITPPPTADVEIELEYYHATGDENPQIIFDQRSGSNTGLVNVTANQNNFFAGVANKLSLQLDTNTVVLSNTDLVPLRWHAIKVTRVANLWSLYLDNKLVGSTTRSFSVDQTGGIRLFRLKTGVQHAGGHIANFRVTAEGVTRTLVPERRGSNVWIMGSDNTAELVAGAIQGDLVNVHGDAPLATEDWPLKYGGRLAGPNLVAYSENFSNNVWQKIDNGSPSLGLTPGVEDPFGGLNAYAANLNGDSGNAGQNALLVNTTITAGVTYTASFYMRAASGAGVGRLATHRVPNGNTLTYVGDRELSLEWKRFTVTFTAVVTTTGGFWIGLNVGAPVPVRIFGYQLHEGSELLPYNKTTGTATSFTSGIAYIPAKTDGTGADGIPPDAKSGELIEGMGLDHTGGVDSAFARRVNLESNYRFGDPRAATEPENTKRKTAQGLIEYNFVASSNPIGDSVVFQTLPGFTLQPQSQVAEFGDTVTFSVAADSDPAPTGYQWRLSTAGGAFVNIPGATGTSYTTPVLASADKGKRWDCVATNALGKRTSDPATIGYAPVNQTLPTITGERAVGYILTGNIGTWAGDDATYTYRWLADEVGIVGAEGTTYTPVAGDAGAIIQFEVTATNASGEVVAVTLAAGVVVVLEARQALLFNKPYFDSSSPLSGYLRDDSPNQDERLPRLAWCRSFDWAGQYLTLGSRITTGTVTTMTAGCWVKFTGTGTYAFMGEYRFGVDQRSWTVLHDSLAPGKLRVIISQDGGFVEAKSYSSTTNINDGQWHLVGFSFSSNTLKLFIDGAEDTVVKSSDATVNSLFNTSEGLSVGAISNSGTPANFFPGRMSDPRVYSSTKTPAQMAAWYNNGLSDFDDPDTEGLLGGWALEEESGATCHDWSGNGNHLTEQGSLTGAWVTDTEKKWSLVNAQGYSPRMLFDGVDDYVEVADADNLSFGNSVEDSPFSLSFSVQSDGFVSGDAISKTNADASIREYRVILNDSSGGLIFALYENDGSARIQARIASVTIDDGNSHRVTCTYDGSGANTGLSIYFDGVLQSSTKSSSGSYVAMHNTSSPLTFGKVSTLFSEGTLSNIVVYNKELSASEASSDYNGTLGTANVVSKWIGDGNTDDAWVDQVGSNDGTVFGSPSQFLLPRVPGTSLDASGSAATYVGRTPYPGRNLTNYVQGDGTGVYMDTGSALIPPTAGFEIELYYYEGTIDSTQRALLSQTETTGPTGRWTITKNFGGTSNELTFFVGLDSNLTVKISDAFEANSWHRIRLARTVDTWTLCCTPVGGVEKSQTVSRSGITLYAGRNTWLLANTSSFLFSDNGRIANLQVTTGDVTRTIVPEGTGRAVRIMGSDNTEVLVPNAIQGTLTSVHGTAALATEDWLLKYGGRQAGPNLLTYSEQFDNAAWSKFETTVTANVVASPFGVITADQLRGTATTNFHQISQPGISSTAATSHGFSVYAKLAPGGSRFLGMASINSTPAGNNQFAVFDLSLGTYLGATSPVTGTGMSGSIEDIGDGWYRCFCTVNPATNGRPLTDSYAPTIRLMNEFSTAGQQYTETTDPGVYLFGAQLHIGSTPLPYRKTEGSPTSYSSGLAYIPAKTDGTGADGLTPDSSPGELLPGREINPRGGIDSPFAQAAGLETTYTHGDARQVGSVFENTKTVDGSVEKEFSTQTRVLPDLSVNGKSPVAAWVPSLDTRGDGTTNLYDLAGGNHGILTNMDPATDWVADADAGGARALSFDGVDDNVNVASALSMVAWSGVTYSFWIRPADDSDNQIVFSHLHSGVDDINFTRISGQGGAIAFQLDDGTRSGSVNVSIASGSWYHIVGTFDGTTAKIYRNGVLQDSFPDSFDFSTATSNLVNIGSRAGLFSWGPGGLDDIRIWNQELDATEVASLYDSGQGRGKVS